MGMYIIDVIPLTKTLGKETLSYFFRKEIAPGTLVSIPLRRREVTALVVASEKMSTRKSEIRGADFSLKKI